MPGTSKAPVHMGTVQSMHACLSEWVEQVLQFSMRKLKIGTWVLIFLAIELNSFDQHELGNSVVTCWVQHATKGESRDLSTIHAYPLATQYGYSGYQQAFMTCGYFGPSEHARNR